MNNKDDILNKNKAQYEQNKETTIKIEFKTSIDIIMVQYFKKNENRFLKLLSF